MKRPFTMAASMAPAGDNKPNAHHPIPVALSGVLGPVGYSSLHARKNQINQNETKLNQFGCETHCSLFTRRPVTSQAT